jgi:hypothetical protein
VITIHVARRTVVERVEFDGGAVPVAMVADAVAGSSGHVVGRADHEGDSVRALYREFAAFVEAISGSDAELEGRAERQVVCQRYGSRQVGRTLLRVVVGQAQYLASLVVGDRVADGGGAIIQLQGRHIRKITEARVKRGSRGGEACEQRCDERRTCGIDCR